MIRFLIMVLIIHGGLWAQGETRYAPLFESLKQSGVSQGRIEAIFSSPKAQRVDDKTLRMISSVGKIPHLRKKEREANAKFLKHVPYLLRHLEKHRSTYDRAEARYKVNREIIAALLQKETALGAYLKFPHDAFVVFNTILGRLKMPENPTRREQLRTKRLKNEARKNLLALILHYEDKGVDITTTKLPSSYAGAMGIPQFTPWLLDEAVSASGGEPDLMKMEDAILSVGHLLRHRFGWPENMIDFSRLTTLDEVRKLWAKYDDGHCNIAHDTNLEGLPVPNFSRKYSHRGDVRYLLPYLRALMQYNFSSDYALGIVTIAKAAASERAPSPD